MTEQRKPPLNTYHHRDAAVTAGTELGWKTTIGATGFEIAYGSAAVKDGATTTEIEIEMTLSF